MNRNLFILILSGAILAISFTLPFGKEVSLKRSNYNKEGFVNTSYGEIPNNSILIMDAIQPNEFLSNVFSKYNLGLEVAYEVGTMPEDIFNVRQFKSGNKYAFVLAHEKGHFIPKKFIYEKNVVDYVVFDFSQEKIATELKSKPIVKKKIISAAVIKGSLYQTLIEIGANPLLAVELADVYRWTIDFYRIQENDFFKAVYYEEFVEGKSTGSFEVEASNFNHFGIDNKAFAYFRESSQQLEYFDEEGHTLKEFFLRAPVAYSRISSPYTMNRYHPVTGQKKAHLGTDYAAPTGTPIYSTANGVVTHATYAKYNGNYVKIKHNSTYSTQYLHMSKIASWIKPGVAVEQGQVIGYVGSTGLATGPHVCYRFWKDGKQVDPYKENIPKAAPLEEEELPSYLNFIESLNQKLDSISLNDTSQEIVI